MEIASSAYRELEESGIDVLFDDRDERAGVKFKDADLLGLPLQLIIGKTSLKDGRIELKLRRSQEKRIIAPSLLRQEVTKLLAMN
jgi:prolyl-tRNA synthetase